MACYIDKPVEWGRIKGGGRATYWCHLLADTDEELHAMAEKIGMKRIWHQPKPDNNWSHYDVGTKRARELALGFGAVNLEKLPVMEVLAILRRLKN